MCKKVLIEKMLAETALKCYPEHLDNGVRTISPACPYNTIFVCIKK